MFFALHTAAELVEKGLEKDYFTEALLRGIGPEDGGGAGTPYITLGDGNCLLNAIAQLFLAEKPRGIRNDVQTLAVKLRLSIVLEGLRHMEAYLSRQEGFFMDWSNYVSEVREKLTKEGWTCSPKPNEMRSASRRTARLLYVAQLSHIATNQRWLQQFVFPLMATVIQALFHPFLPCEYSRINLC